MTSLEDATLDEIKDELMSRVGSDRRISVWLDSHETVSSVEIDFQHLELGNEVLRKCINNG
jgi:hypothetical protein